jgi:hypothetical protein
MRIRAQCVDELKLLEGFIADNAEARGTAEGVGTPLSQGEIKASARGIAAGQA